MGQRGVAVMCPTFPDNKCDIFSHSDLLMTFGPWDISRGNAPTACASSFPQFAARRGDHELNAEIRD